MGRFSRKINRQPDSTRLPGRPRVGFIGTKKKNKLLHKAMVKAQLEYFRLLKAGLITEDGTPVEQETTDEQE